MRRSPVRTAGSMINCGVEWGVPCGKKKNHRDISRCRLHFFKTQIWFIGVPHFYFYDPRLYWLKYEKLETLSCNFVSPAKPSVSEQQRNAALFHWITPEVSFPVVRLRSCESHMLSFFFFSFPEYQRVCKVRPRDQRPLLRRASLSVPRGKHLHVWR